MEKYSGVLASIFRSSSMPWIVGPTTGGGGETPDLRGSTSMDDESDIELLRRRRLPTTTVTECTYCEKTLPPKKIDAPSEGRIGFITSLNRRLLLLYMFVLTYFVCFFKG